MPNEVAAREVREFSEWNDSPKPNSKLGSGYKVM
jgi:hypothetical protein